MEMWNKKLRYRMVVWSGLMCGLCAALCMLSSAAIAQEQQDAASESGETSRPDVELEPKPEPPKVKSRRPDFFDTPTDFSSPPKIPESIEGPSPSEIQSSIDRGVRFLLETQNTDGSFGSHVSKRIGEVFAPVPGSHHAFRGATTALAVSSLIECKPNDPEVQKSVQGAKKWIFEKFGRIKRAQGDAIYNVWAHAYGIQALVKLKSVEGQSDEDTKRIDALIRLQIEMLVKYESVDGGWGYYDFRFQARKPTASSISFVNATVLIAFKEAQQAGFEIPKKIIKRAYDAIERQQKPDFSYLYGEYLKTMPMRGINRPGGSLGRSQACNLAMRLWGDEKITDNVLKSWLYRLYLRNGWLGIGRKRPIPHEAWMQVAGYFYWIDDRPTAS